MLRASSRGAVPEEDCAMAQEGPTLRHRIVIDTTLRLIYRLTVLELSVGQVNF